MYIKICGITGIEDARQALQAGADWIGLNLVAGPRRIEVARAAEILAHLDDASRAVVLVSVEDRRTFRLLPELYRRGVRHVQLYGAVATSTIKKVRRERLHSILPWQAGSDRHAGRGSGSWRSTLEAFLEGCGKSPPDYLLLDAEAEGGLGGTGRKADWWSIASLRREASGGAAASAWPPVILAGGLAPENVAAAISMVRPDGVDVSSGVESTPGHKDHAAVAAFIGAVRNSDVG